MKYLLYILLLVALCGCVHNRTPQEKFDYCQQKYLKPDNSNVLQFLQCLDYQYND